ncbi:MAG: pyrroline-5-carboxylate reductase [Candidatus Verstraetearchaeota archaeon]|nr:pyrroline-5-carboxylate reductase [Candidatus Verstraetearchaeota archaeon]
MKVGIMGFGKMGSSLISGGIRSGVLKRDEVCIYDLDSERVKFAESEGLSIAKSLDDVVDSDSLIIAVKPKDLTDLLSSAKASLIERRPLLISIVAGIRIEKLQSMLDDVQMRIVRVMPNIAASVNEAISAYCTSKSVRKEDLEFINSLLCGVGKAVFVDNEDELDIITGVSGSGPAYFSLMMGAMEKVAIERGIERNLARMMVAQTCRGAATMILERGISPEELIRMVASPGGTTEEALKVMEERKFSLIVSDAVSAAIEKSRRINR